MSTIIPFSALESSTLGWEFEGYKFDNTNITFIVVEAAPGDGPKLHRHPYAEIFITLEGSALFTIGDKTIEVTGGQVIIAPPGVPHKFINNGKGILRQVDIHLNPKFITHWLES